MPPESVRSDVDRPPPRPGRGLGALVLAVGAAGLGCAVDTRASARTEPPQASPAPRALCRPWTPEPCLTRVGASLHGERSRQPIAGKRLWFFSHGAMICSSVTDGSGVASCHGLAPSGQALADAGYSVVVEGDTDLPMRVVHVR
jgi:hypothetical protein